MESRSGRIRLLDILRGFAILGTLGTNIWIFAHLGDLNYIMFSQHYTWWASAEDVIRVVVLFLVNGKLLGLLTIMFGAGLELKYQQALRRGTAWPGMYVWTSLILMTEGFIHFTLVMEYDILMSYGITAIIVSFIVKGGDRSIRRTMKVTGGIHGAVMFLLIIMGIVLASMGANLSMGNMSQAVLLYEQGSWSEQVWDRLNNFLILRSEAIFLIPMNVFLFLLGVRLMRSGTFHADEQGRAKRKSLMRIGLYAGIPLNLLIFVPGGYMDLPVRYLFAPVMSLGYLAFIALLVEKNEQFWLWRRLELVGKMSLSCYVIQNIVATSIFYGWGLGLGGQVDSVEIVMIWILICAFLMLFATTWQKYFKYGPMEALRRWTTRLVSRLI